MESSQKRGRAFKDASLCRWACKIGVLAFVSAGITIILVIILIVLIDLGVLMEVSEIC